MKIKVTTDTYENICAKIQKHHVQPQKPSRLLRSIIRLAANRDLKKAHFTYQTFGMDQLPAQQPCLILMNHSSFIDLEICAQIFARRPYNIVCTSDGFVGKEALMRKIGCIPTQKFVMDLSLVKDMKYALETLGDSILMYPEASYSFDGTATPLPDSVGKCIKLLKVPVVMVRTYGAFLRDPLYNGLQVRDVSVSADVTYLFSVDDIKQKSVAELNHVLKEQFSFDHFRWQQEHQIAIREPFRADHLNRVLYKCPHCKTEGQMEGKGVTIQCHSCGAIYELNEYGALHSLNRETVFSHVPDWYRWERECVRQELHAGTYRLEADVDICMLVDFKQIYRIGRGHLLHTADGFCLDGCDGKLHYTRRPKDSYSLYADYFWYELGDMICIGDKEKLFYCFPIQAGDIAAKARLATEELYRMVTQI